MQQRPQDGQSWPRHSGVSGLPRGGVSCLLFLEIKHVSRDFIQEGGPSNIEYNDDISFSLFIFLSSAFMLILLCKENFYVSVSGGKCKW